MDNDDLNRLNPLIREVVVGTRKLRMIKVYPLSMSDQLELSAIFVKTIQSVVSTDTTNNFVFADTIRKAISENIGKVLSLITEEGESLLKEVSNVQAMEIGEIVYDMNYGILEKKVKSLAEKVRKTFLLQTSSPPSSENILNTELKTSSEKVSEMEELQSDK